MDILSGIVLPIVYALGIGLLASIAPCSLTSNVAALAYVSEQISSPRRTIMAGLAYLAGRALAYGTIGLFVLAMGVAIIASTDSFRDYGTLVLGAILIIAGAVILDKLKLNFSIGSGIFSRYFDKLSSGSVPGAFGLGVIFSLGFCPYMAALFFGLLIPLAIGSSAIGAGLPLVFGIATGLPVLAFTSMAALGVSRADEYVERVRKTEPLIRKLFGAGLIIYGFYLIFVLIM